MNEENKAGEVLFAYGYIHHFLEGYARSCQTPQSELTSRLAELLHAEASGAVLRATNSMPTLRRKATGNKAVRTVAMARRTYSKTSRKKMTKATRLRLSKWKKAWW